MKKCAWCKEFIGNCSGESGIYKSHHLLCEECFLKEDELIEKEGTNNIPSQLKIYNSPHSASR